jgi:predicted DNA-binding ribbon-helix-helix protein
MPLEKRSLTLEGHRTSLALEPEFWDGLTALAAKRGISVPRVVAEIDRARADRSLASAVRLAVLVGLPDAAPEEAPPSDEEASDAAG